MIVALLTTFYLAAASPLVSPEYDFFAGAAEVVRYSFEADEDRDFDRQPDDWTRRKGPGFPAYVSIEIDRTCGRDGQQSLQFRLNGGAAILYSPAVRIDDRHSYVFRGGIRTQLLEHDAAVLSVSLLNHKRERVQRFVSEPVSGTHAGWVEVQIGPMTPRPDATFAVIGCHLVSGDRSDIRGSVWFDDLRLGRLPQMHLGGRFDSYYRRPGEEVRVPMQVRGLDDGRTYRVDLQVLDPEGQVVAELTKPLAQEDEAATSDSAGPPAAEPMTTEPTLTWTIPPCPLGYHEVRATLVCDGLPILRQGSSFVVMDFVEPARHGAFGWSVESQIERLPLREFVELAAQSGLNRLKYPLWETSSGSDPRGTELGMMLDMLTHRGLHPVGMLSAPPTEIRSQFARDWSGTAEVFAMPPSFWAESLQPAVVRYSSNVRDWQLGGDDDGSYVGRQDLPATVGAVKQELDRLGRDTRIALPWSWDAAPPERVRLPRSFLSLVSPDGQSPDELTEQLEAAAGSGLPRWVVVKPLPTGRSIETERAANLVKRMVAAKVGGADAVFAYDVFDPRHGLLNADGSPTPLYLPWRTAALALQGTESLGSLKLPGKSRNFNFAREGEAVLVVWNQKPVVEELYLGERASIVDLWGRPVEMKQNAGERRMVDVGPEPLIVRGISEPLARWRSAVRFEKGKVESRYGGHEDVLVGRNTFPQGVSGTVTIVMPPGWGIEPRTFSLQTAAGETFRQPVVITLPANASLGEATVAIDFDLSAERPYRFRIYQPYDVGLDDIGIEIVERRRDDGQLEIEQIITNRTDPEETLNLRCSLFVPGMKRQHSLVTRLRRGEDRKIYVLPNAESLQGQELWLRAEQMDGLRVLNYKWTVGKE